MVCLSSSPTNAKIIRTASRMADAFKGTFTALFVETSDFPNISEEDKKRLRENIHLAERSGARLKPFTVMTLRSKSQNLQGYPVFLKLWLEEVPQKENTFLQSQR